MRQGGQSRADELNGEQIRESEREERSFAFAFWKLATKRVRTRTRTQTCVRACVDLATGLWIGVVSQRHVTD
jgi:hypothetical protein